MERELALICATSGNDYEGVRTLLEGEEIEGTDSALNLAIGKGYLNLTRLFIEHGVDLDDGRFVLTACEYGHTNIVRLLLQHSAKVNPWCLHNALKIDDEMMIDLILDRVKDFNESQLIYSAMFAVALGNPKVTRFILELETFPRRCLDELMQLSLVLGLSEMKRLLVEFGADENLTVDTTIMEFYSMLVGHTMSTDHGS